MAKGTGETSMEVLVELQAKLAAGFRAQLAGLEARKLLKKKQVEDMAAGFQDGQRSMWQALEEMGVIAVARREG